MPGLETASQPFLPFCNNPVGPSWKSRRSLVDPPSSAHRESRCHPSALLLGRSLRIAVPTARGSTYARTWFKFSLLRKEDLNH
ncbi:hypothetical protein PIB30_086165 [Stylosanthes scabra]|uniref:Uncharacterized protein n=1 Tax=Stylosanthes scabra TaxID=79078 RepID=A0ABU6SUK1_9FABA|nr:hypothetical protein [Stylosanthes scabra]